jgi:hypothetical protein
MNPTRSKTVCFLRAWVMKPLNYWLQDIVIPEASCCKYLRIIIHNNLSWADQANCTVKKAWEALHFTIFKRYDNFNSWNGPVKANFACLCTSSCCGLQNTLIVRLCSRQGTKERVQICMLIRTIQTGQPCHTER